MPVIKTADEKREQKLWWFLTAALVLCGLVFFWGLVFRFPLMVYRRYVAMLAWAAMAIFAYKGVFHWRSIYALGLALVGWYVVTRWIHGDTYLNTSYNAIIEFSVAYGLVLPFAKATGEGERRRAFDILALVYVLCLFFMAIPGLWCSLTNKLIEVPFSGVTYEMQQNRLYAMGQNPNAAGAMLNVGLFLSIYLVATYWRKWLAVPGLLVILVYFFSVSVTVSRGAIVGRAVGLGIMACLFVGKIRISKKWLRIGVLAATFLVGTLVFYKASDVSVDILTKVSRMEFMQEYVEVEEVPADAAVEELQTEERDAAASRSVLTALGTLGARTPIYREFFAGVRANPSVLAVGTPDSEVMLLLDEYQLWSHLHNSYLQVLGLLGIPGLLIALAMSVIILLAALKLLLDEKKTMGQRILPIIMVPLVLHGMLESFLFVPWFTLSSSTFVNVVFLLCAGYTVEMAKGLKFKELLRIGK